MVAFSVNIRKSLNSGKFELAVSAVDNSSTFGKHAIGCKSFITVVCYTAVFGKLMYCDVSNIIPCKTGSWRVEQ